MLEMFRCPIQMMKIRTYSELSQMKTFLERYKYLKLNGVPGSDTFGFDRWINQEFYRSHEWRQARDFVIIRDEGCDLGILGYEIRNNLLVHHMNPISLNDLNQVNREKIIDPNFLITTSLQTHNAIHYGDENQLPRGPVVRRHGDTKLW